MRSFPEFLHPYLCEVLQPWRDPHSGGRGERARGRSRGRGRGDGSGVASVLRYWNGLVHDDRLALIVAHVEAWRGRLRVSVATRGRRVGMRNHGVRCLVGGARITWKNTPRDQGAALKFHRRKQPQNFYNANKISFTSADVSMCGRWCLHRNDKCVRVCVCVWGNRSSHTANKLLISQAAAEEEHRNQTCELQHIVVPQFCISLNSGFRYELVFVFVCVLLFFILMFLLKTDQFKQDQVFQQTQTGKCAFHRT